MTRQCFSALGVSTQQDRWRNKCVHCVLCQALTVANIHYKTLKQTFVTIILVFSFDSANISVLIVAASCFAKQSVQMLRSSVCSSKKKVIKGSLTLSINCTNCRQKLLSTFNKEKINFLTKKKYCGTVVKLKSFASLLLKLN